MFQTFVKFFLKSHHLLCLILENKFSTFLNVSMIEYPFTLSLRPRKGSIVDHLHLTADQDLFFNLLLNSIFQCQVSCRITPLQSFYFNCHIVLTVLFPVEVNLVLTANPLRLREDVVDLTRVDIDCSEDKHIV